MITSNDVPYLVTQQNSTGSTVSVQNSRVLYSRIFYFFVKKIKKSQWISISISFTSITVSSPTGDNLGQLDTHIGIKSTLTATYVHNIYYLENLFKLTSVQKISCIC